MYNGKRDRRYLNFKKDIRLEMVILDALASRPKLRYVVSTAEKSHALRDPGGFKMK